MKKGKETQKGNRKGIKKKKVNECKIEERNEGRRKEYNAKKNR